MKTMTAHRAATAAFAVLVLVASLLIAFGSATTASAATGGTGNIPTPFPAGLSTYVFQGYNSGTHKGTSLYGLDLTAGSSTTSTAGRPVIAPVAGSVSYWQPSKGNLCVNTTDGHSYSLTHINPSGSFKPGQHVDAGQQVGKVAAADPPNNPIVGNNGVAHLHFEFWGSKGCYNSNTIPFDAAHGLEICGAPDFPATGPNNNGVWGHTTFTASTCGPAKPSLDGKLTEYGQPVAKAKVTVFSSATGSSVATTTTDSFGVWQIFGLPAGAYTVKFSDGTGGFYDQFYTGSTPDKDSDEWGATVQVKGNGTTLELDQAVAQAISLTIRFVDWTTGRPISGIDAFAGGNGGNSTISGADGVATIPDAFPTDLYCMDANPAQPSTSDYMEWAGYTYSSNMTIHLKKAATISGKVVDLSGNPVAGVTVNAYRQEFVSGGGSFGCYDHFDTYDNRSAVTSSDGTYTITRLFGGNGYYVRPTAISSNPPSRGPLSVASNGGALTNVNYVDPVHPRPLTATPVPTIIGAARSGSTLTAKAGTWQPSPVTLTYQWLRNGASIAGATKTSYKLASADVGKKITVRVTGAKSGYTTVSKTSSPTSTVQ